MPTIRAKQPKRVKEIARRRKKVKKIITICILGAFLAITSCFIAYFLLIK